jgi:putative transposase
MSTGRPKAPILLSEDEKLQLKALANSRSLPHGLVMRARLVLMAADG